MYCNKCGTQNPDDAVYCKKCGSLMEQEDETRVSVKLRNISPETGLESLQSSTLDHGRDDVGKRIFSIAPTVKFVMAGYAAAVIGAFLLVAVFSVFLSSWIGLGSGVLLGLAVLLIPAYYHIRQKLVRYSLTDSTIEIDRGFISRTTQNIPLRRVQDVTVSATFVQRLLGYGDITIDNASEDGGKVVLDNVDSPRRYADMILKQMRLLDR